MLPPPEMTMTLEPMKLDVSSLADVLGSEYMLANIRIGVWSGKFKDRVAAVEIAASDVNRMYFPDKYGGAFATINKMLNKTRADHYAMTLPWCAESGEGVRRTGPRLLPNERFFEHATVIAQAEAKLPQMLDAIEVGYAQLVQDAAHVCNQGKFGPEFYPTMEELRQKYMLSRDYQPVPVPQDFGRMSLDGRVIEKMIARMAGAQNEMLNNAVSDLWERLTEATGHLAERCTDDDEGKPKRLHASLVDNLAAVRKQVTQFRLEQQPEVASILEVLDREVSPLTIKMLRDDVEARRTARTVCTDLAQRMAQLQ